GMTIEARAGDTTLAPDLEKRGKKRDRAHLSTPPDAQAQHADSMKNLVSRVSQLGFDKLNKERKEGKVQQQLVDEYTAVVNGDLMKVAAETERDMEKKEGDHSEPGSANTSPTSSESGFSDNDSGNEADEEDTRAGKSQSRFKRPHISPSNLQHALRFLDIARANFITRSNGYRRELVDVVLMGFAKEREELIASVHKAEERAEKRLKSN
ncbi:hypothetical protein H0H93_001139, partial [Arthromyces matolae]